MIPDFQSIMLPLLSLMGDRQTRTLSEIVEIISEKNDLSAEERKETIPSGNQPLIKNRVSWVITYLKKAGLIRSPKRATFEITENGIAILRKKPSAINVAFLKEIPDFKNWQNEYKSREKEVESEGTIIESEKTPHELLDYSYRKLTEELSRELLEKVKECSPEFFESLVVDLLVKMGYGGSRQEAGKVVGKSNDGGIDGIIKEDKLGLDTIYIQAKRWEGTVPAKEVRDFGGALLLKKARKGVFITTSKFTEPAYEIEHLEHKIILIDGLKLVELMIEYNIGLSVQNTYDLKKIDIDYFEEVF